MTRNRSTGGADIPMRVLFLVHSLRRGGAERVLLEIALGLRAKGHLVEVVAWLDVDDYGEERYASVPRHFLMPKDEYRWPWSIPRAASRLRDLARRLRPDVLELHDHTVAWVAAWANLKVPCVHVVQGYGIITRRGSFKDWVMRAGNRLSHMALKVDFIVPTSPMADVALSYFAKRSARFDCVPNGVDVASFIPVSKLPDNAPRIMMLGTLSPNKGQQWGVRAMELLLRQIPEARLMIVGEGSYRGELEVLIREMGLEGNVELLGRRMDAFELMSASHLFWHLSESEGLPMVVLEAMASGVPVIGFDVRGTRDVVDDGHTGYLVPFGSLEAVVRRTVDILTDNTAYKELSSNARRRVEELFSIDNMVDGHESALTISAGRIPQSNNRGGYEA